MDLKDVINDVLEKGPEAHSAFHAGHQVVAQRYLQEIHELIGKFFDEKGMPESGVTKETTSEISEVKQEETQDAVPGAQIRPAAVDPEQLAQPAEHVPESQQETR